MMLARVADALYWMGRYVERAENVARLLTVTCDFGTELEGLDERLAQKEWEGVLQILLGSDARWEDYVSPSAARSALLGGKRGSLPYVKALLADETNPASVLYSVERARENARSVGETLTREVFVNLNELRLLLLRYRDRPPADDAGAHDAIEEVHRAVLTLLGAMEHTLSRDEGWTYLKLGETMERGGRTATVLRRKLPTLLESADGEETLRYARWRQLLLTVASLENFRRVHGAALDGKKVARFLLFDIPAPRALAGCTARAKRYLDSLSKGDPGVATAARIVGRLNADLTYGGDDLLRGGGAPFLDEAVARLSAAHDAATHARRL